MPAVVLDIEYHGVEVEHLPTVVYSWLENRLGTSGDRWFTKGTIGGTMIYFKYQRDHTLFLLTWAK